MADPGIVEVRCERCKTSFAPETRQCIHCGGPLGRGRLFRAPGSERPSAASSAVPLERTGDEASVRSAEGLFEADAEEAAEDLSSRGRNLVWLFTALAFMLMSALRNCGAGPG